MARKSRNTAAVADAAAATVATVTPTVDAPTTSAAVVDAIASTVSPTSVDAPTVDARAEKRARDAAVRDAAGRLFRTIAENGLTLALCDAVFGHARRNAGKDVRSGTTAERQSVVIRYARAAMADVGAVSAVERIIADVELCMTLPGATIAGGYSAGAIAGAIVGIVDTVTSIRRSIQGK